MTKKELKTVRERNKRWKNKIDRYRSFFGDRPETIFRDETNEEAKKSELLIDALNSIDRCFVDADANGIREILKQAETDTELSNWSKLRIINECRAALLDLCI